MPTKPEASIIDTVRNIYGCYRCEINNEDNPKRMCPCPRGGCEAIVVGLEKIHKIIEVFSDEKEK